MTSNAMFLAELVLFDGVAVAWGVWEFWSARPNRTAKVKDVDLKEQASAETSGHPER